MSEPQRDEAATRFFGNAFIAVGWLVLTLGGLCTLAVGVLSFTVAGEPHTSLEDWTLPGGMLACGGASLWIGRAIKRSLRTPPSPGPDA